MVKGALHGYANREGMAVGGLSQAARALLGIAVRLVSQPTAAQPKRAASESALPSLALRSHALQCAAVAVTVFVFSVGSYSAVCGVPRNMPREPPGGSAATAGRRAWSSASAARVTSPRRSRGSKRSARMCTAHTRRASCCSHRRRRRCAQRRWLEALEIPHPSTHASVQHVPRQRRGLI